MGQAIKKFAYWLEVAALGIVLGLILQSAKAWTEPPAGVTPPGGNLGAPINTSTITQVKSGPMGLNAAGAVNSLGLLMNGKAQADDFCLNSDSTKCLSKAGGGIATGLYGWCQESLNNISTCGDCNSITSLANCSSTKSPASCVSSKCSCPSGYTLVKMGDHIVTSPGSSNCSSGGEFPFMSSNCDIAVYYTCIKN